MEQAKLQKIIEEHEKWLRTDGVEGKRADLRNADLSGADLSGADLRFADLRFADLRNANLIYADLSRADLRNANLRFADLSRANLRNADLSGADLSGADLDFSSLPLWCGSLDVCIDDRQAVQLLYHLLRNIKYSKNTSPSVKKICKLKTLVRLANKFHRKDECGEITLD